MMGLLSRGPVQVGQLQSRGLSSRRRLEGRRADGVSDLAGGEAILPGERGRPGLGRRMRRQVLRPRCLAQGCVRHGQRDRGEQSLVEHTGTGPRLLAGHEYEPAVLGCRARNRLELSLGLVAEESLGVLEIESGPQQEPFPERQAQEVLEVLLLPEQSHDVQREQTTTQPSAGRQGKLAPADAVRAVEVEHEAPRVRHLPVPHVLQQADHSLLDRRVDEEVDLGGGWKEHLNEVEKPAVDVAAVEEETQDPGVETEELRQAARTRRTRRIADLLRDLGAHKGAVIGEHRAARRAVVLRRRTPGRE